MGVAARVRLPEPSRASAPRLTVSARPAGERIRRIIDIVIASMLLALLLPVLLVAALAVRVSSGSPVFFGHVRLGRDGRPFRCWKLRTMRADAEQALDEAPDLKARYVANGYKLPLGADPRVTPIGRILRRTYIDELPQLLNVRNGTMSLIGPRPIVRAELDNFGPDGAELLRVRPGIIGAWTSRGRHRPAYPERARIELEYVRTRSIVGDARILLRALPVVLTGLPEDV